MKLFLLVALLLNGALAPSGSRTKTRAFLTEIKGDVKIQTARERVAKPASADVAFLYDGDIIHLGDDGEAVLWQAYSPVSLLKPKNSKQINSLPQKSGSGILSLSDYLKCESEMLKAYAGIRRESSRTKGNRRQTPIAHTPRRSYVLDRRPTFAWTAVPNAESYTVVLYDDPTQREIWRTRTRETRLTYPDSREVASAKPLTPGKYRWEVSTGREDTIDGSSFTIVTPEEAATIQAALTAARSLTTDATLNFAYLAVCFEHRQYPEAARVLQEALARDPSQALVKALLLEAYESMGRFDEREDLREAFPADRFLEIGQKLRVPER